MIRRKYRNIFGELNKHYDETWRVPAGIAHETPVTMDAHKLAEKILKEMFALEPGARSMAVILITMAMLRGYLLKPMRMMFECRIDELFRKFTIAYDQDFWMCDSGCIAVAFHYFLNGKKYPRDPFKELEMMLAHEERG